MKRFADFRWIEEERLSTGFVREMNVGRVDGPAFARTELSRSVLLRSGVIGAQRGQPRRRGQQAGDKKPREPRAFFEHAPFLSAPQGLEPIRGWFARGRMKE